MTRTQWTLVLRRIDGEPVAAFPSHLAALNWGGYQPAWHRIVGATVRLELDTTHGRESIAPRCVEWNTWE